MRTTVLSLARLRRADIAGVGSDLLLTHSIRLWELFAQPCRIDGYAIIVVMAGEIDVEINGRPYCLGPDTLAVDFPENVLRVLRHEGVEAYAVLMSRRCFDDLHIDLAPLARIYSDFRAHVVFPLPHAEVLPLYHYFALLRHNAADFCEARRPVVRGLLRAGVFQLFDIIRRAAALPAATMQAAPGRQAQLFADFLALLADRCRSERTVQYYAGQMCLTPRHLSAVIKAYSGRGAAEWIADYVAMEAKRLLANPAANVQEVARQLGFPSQSAFGKFFKKAEGVGPAAWKQSARN